MGGWPKNRCKVRLVGCELSKLKGDWLQKQMGLGLTPLHNSGSVTLGRLRCFRGAICDANTLVSAS